MATVTRRRKKTVSRADALLARRSGEALTRLIQSGVRSPYRFRVVAEENTEAAGSYGTAGGIEIMLPDEAMHVLASALAEIAKGHAVMTVPATSELTPQQAADLLGISRPFLLQLVRSERIPARFVGTHRRLKLEDVLAYQAGQEKRYGILDELAAQAQELGMGC